MSRPAGFDNNSTKKLSEGISPKMNVVEQRAVRLTDSFAGFRVATAFFLSGAAALIYQVVWQRMLTFFGGADVYSVTIIVAAFMGGLGFGSLAGGHLADRLTSRAALASFALCEAAVAVFAFFSSSLYYDLLYVQLGAWAFSRATLGAMVFAVTLWPTFFMGMSLPLLVRALTTDPRRPAHWVPLLYGTNTLGAACGSLFATAILFRTFDFVTNVRLGALLTGLCAAGALLAVARSPREQPQASAPVHWARFVPGFPRRSFGRADCWSVAPPSRCIALRENRRSANAHRACSG